MTPPPLSARLRELAAVATKVVVRAMRDGNQYTNARNFPNMKLVGASRIDGLTRPWNPFAMLAFGLKGEDHEVVRFRDEDADLIEELWNNVEAIVRALEAIEGAEKALAKALPLLRIIRFRQVIDAGDDAIEASGINPWAINEGLATGDEPLSLEWAESALATVRAAKEGA